MKRNRFVSSVATAEEPQILNSDIELVGLNSLGHLLILQQQANFVLQRIDATFDLPPQYRFYFLP